MSRKSAVARIASCNSSFKNGRSNGFQRWHSTFKMLKDEEMQYFFNSRNFYKMLVKAGNDDMIGYKNNNDWIPEHPPTALIFENPQETWEQLSTEYNGN